MYIGGSTDITGRYTHHRFNLRRGIHKTAELQRLWSEDGEAAFEFVTLEACSPDAVTSREDAWIKATPDRLNTAAGATTGTFSAPSEARKQAARDRWARPEYRAKQKARIAKRNNGSLIPKASQGAAP